MEQRILKIVNNCFNTNIYSYLETSGANVIKQYLGKLPWYFNPTISRVKILWQITVENLHGILILSIIG